jgi:hypothetical protein
VLTIVAAPGTRTRIVVPPSPRAIVSWNATAERATIELVVHRADGRSSLALPYVVFDPEGRSSLDGFDAVARIATDVVSAPVPIVALDVCATAPLLRVAVATPPEPAATPEHDAPRPASELDVPICSQYVDAFPEQRGWCAPAAVAMLLGHWGIACEVASVAAAIHDRAYRGTGNWAFAVAHAAGHALLGAAAYLPGLAALAALVEAGIPAAVSIAWSEGALPGAPLPRSAGHLVVVRGFDAGGDVLVNDPAVAGVRTRYPRAAFAQAWLGHGGVALLVAPPERAAALARAAGR